MVREGGTEGGREGHSQCKPPSLDTLVSQPGRAGVWAGRAPLPKPVSEWWRHSWSPAICFPHEDKLGQADTKRQKQRCG